MFLEIALPFAFIFLLVLISGLFSGSETGVTGASKATIHRLSTEGNKRAEVVQSLQQVQDRMIGVILLGNNSVNILASALATSMAIEYFGDEGVVYATILMTLVILIFAEVLPKTYAINNAERVALFLAPLLQFALKLLGPIADMIQALVNISLSVFGVKIERMDIVSSTDALRGAIDLHHKDEKEQADRKHMLDSILDLDEIDVAEVMVHRKKMVSEDADQPIGTIISSLLQSGFTRLPLWRGKPDNIIGVLHVKSLLNALQQHDGGLESLPLMEIIMKPWFVPETTRLSDQLMAFRKERNHFALVIDEYGVLVGLITLEDILEEIVGRIEDEHDGIFTGIKPARSGGFILDGDVSIRDINRELGWDLPDEHAATIAGLVMHEAQVIPEKGQVFRFYHITFEVIAKKGNQITRLRAILEKGHEDV